jgi:hypothetical protein
MMDPTNQPVWVLVIAPARANQSIGADLFFLPCEQNAGHKESNPRPALLASTEEAA